MIMKIIGKSIIPNNGKEAFEIAVKNAKHRYDVERSISGYYRLRQDGNLVIEDSACEDTNEEDSAYYFFAEWIKEYDKE